MTINYQFGDVDAHGAMIRAQAGLLEAEHQAIIRDVLTASDFWGGAGSAACQGFITQLGRNFQVIYEDVDLKLVAQQTPGFVGADLENVLNEAALVAARRVKGREAILRVHAKNKPLAQDVDLKLVAQQTPGFVGADLENVLNEAALVAARRDIVIMSSHF